MADPDLNIQPLIAAIVDYALASGRFDMVQGHEPKSAPGSGVTGGCWLQDIRPTPAGAGSGLAATSVVVNLIFRVYSNMLQEPQDGIDPNAVAAASAVFTAIGNDIDFSTLNTGMSVRNVDLLGSTGNPLRLQAGYANLSGKLYRIMDVFVPIIVNDVFAQV